MNYEILMKSLQEKYLKSLPATIELIEKSLATSDWASVLMEFHKLRGSGTTYGFEEVSELGYAVEKICQANPQPKKELIADAITLLKEILAQRQNGAVLDLKNNAVFRALAHKL